MKPNNFISLLICLGLMFVVSSCKDREEPRELGCWAVIVCAETFENTPDISELPISISNVRIEGNVLRMMLTGNQIQLEDNQTRLSITKPFLEIVTDGIVTVFPSNPPQGHTRTLRILLAESLPWNEVPGIDFHFYIECLQVEGTNRMWLHFQGTEYGVLYEW